MEESLVKNAADVEQVEKANEKERFGRELELNDLALILSSREGRRFIWRMFEFVRMHELSFAADSSAITNFNEGMKNVGHKLLADIMECRPEAYIEMINENKREGKSNGGRNKDRR